MIFSYVLFKLTTVYAYVMRNVSYYLSYVVFLLRNVTSGNVKYIDHRFNRAHTQHVYPFLHVCEISFLDEFDNVVLVSDATYENMRNVGLCVHDEGDDEGYDEIDDEGGDEIDDEIDDDNEYVECDDFNNIKRFCRVPDSVNSIRCKNYPWIHPAHQNMILDASSSLKSICKNMNK